MVDLMRTFHGGHDLFRGQFRSRILSAAELRFGGLSQLNLNVAPGWGRRLGAGGLADKPYRDDNGKQSPGLMHFVLLERRIYLFHLTDCEDLPDQSCDEDMVSLDLASRFARATPQPEAPIRYSMGPYASPQIMVTVPFMPDSAWAFPSLSLMLHDSPAVPVAMGTNHHSVVPPG